DKQEGHYWIAPDADGAWPVWLPGPEDEERRGRQGVEGEGGTDELISQLLEIEEQHPANAQNTRKHDRYPGRLEPRVHPRHELEEQPVIRHGEENARRCEDRPEERAER